MLMRYLVASPVTQAQFQEDDCSSSQPGDATAPKGHPLCRGLVNENDSCVSASGETETRVPEGSPRKLKMLQILGIGHGVPGTRSCFCCHAFPEKMH